MKERRKKGLFWGRAWKLVEGCSKVSAGCDNCWSERETRRWALHPNPKIAGRAQFVLSPDGQRFVDILCREDNLDLPLRTRKPTVWAIWNDLFHEDVPDEFRDRAYAVMALCPQHTFLVLTKRAERMAEYFSRHGFPGILQDAHILAGGQRVWGSDNAPTWPLPNVWHGVTAENQRDADERIPHLLRVPGNRLVNCEPLLGPVDLSGYFRDSDGWYCPTCDREVASASVTYEETHDVRCEGGCGEKVTEFPLNLHAVLAGGESDGRPCHPDWARSLRDQCSAADVPFFWKQWGEWASVSEVEGPGEHHYFPDGETVRRVGKKKAGRLLDGRTHDELPWGG